MVVFGFFLVGVKGSISSHVLSENKEIKQRRQKKYFKQIHTYKHFCFHSFSLEVAWLFSKMYPFAHDLDSRTFYLLSHLDLSLNISSLDTLFPPIGSSPSSHTLSLLHNLSSSKNPFPALSLPPSLTVSLSTYFQFQLKFPLFPVWIGL